VLLHSLAFGFSRACEYYLSSCEENVAMLLCWCCLLCNVWWSWFMREELTVTHSVLRLVIMCLVQFVMMCSIFKKLIISFELVNSCCDSVLWHMSIGEQVSVEAILPTCCFWCRPTVSKRLICSGDTLTLLIWSWISVQFWICCLSYYGCMANAVVQCGIIDISWAKGLLFYPNSAQDIDIYF